MVEAEMIVRQDENGLWQWTLIISAALCPVVRGRDGFATAPDALSQAQEVVEAVGAATVRVQTSAPADEIAPSGHIPPDSGSIRDNVPEQERQDGPSATITSAPVAKVGPACTRCGNAMLAANAGLCGSCRAIDNPAANDCQPADAMQSLGAACGLALKRVARHCPSCHATGVRVHQQGDNWHCSHCGLEWGTAP